MKFPAVFNVDNLNGNNGFTITSSSAGFGYSVSYVGDINGDNKMDMIIGADLSQITYVIFGSNNFPITFDTSILDGTNGFTIVSSAPRFGCCVASIGDINGDNLTDIAIGFSQGNPDIMDKSYVIFGSRTFPARVNTSQLNGINGFAVMPLSAAGVAGLGDVNGDGKQDMLIGSSPNSKAYVIFGAQSFPAVFDLSKLNGANGFTITYSGSTSYGGFGWGVGGIGDINNDGKSDFGVGCYIDNKMFIIFGATHFPSVLDTSSLYGNNGFTIIAPNVPNEGYFGISIAAIGDLNGDDKLDFAVGTRYAQLAFAIFGAKDFPVTLDVTNLNGRNGFKLTSPSAGFGNTIAGLGDINGDNRPDFGICTMNAGKSFVIYGADAFPASLDTSSLNGSNGFALVSSINGFGFTMAGLGDLIDTGRVDFIIGATAAHSQLLLEESKAYVIYGFGEKMRQNYGMISQIKYFVPMNKTESAGKLYIGATGFWCKSESLFIGDFNGDSRSDLLCSLDDGQNYMMLSYVTSNGIGFSPMGNGPNGRIKIGNHDKWCVKSYQELLIGDFNNDGKSDLLCHNNQQTNQGFTYVMLSTGDGFKPMADSLDGYVRVGRLGEFCPIGGRLVIGNFDGINGDDLLCNDRSAGNMIMIPKNTSFVPISSDSLGTVNLGVMRACTDVWCTRAGSVLMSGHFNNDNRSDLICNEGGQNEIMLASFKNDSSCSFQAINPAVGGQQPNGWIQMGQGKGKYAIWCDSTKTKLIVADIDGDNLDDLVCNTAGVHEIQLCKSMGNDQYEFRSINAGDPSGSGRTKIANYDVWCNSQSISTGHFSDSGLDDLWCNQDYSPVGALADEVEY